MFILKTIYLTNVHSENYLSNVHSEATRALGAEWRTAERTGRQLKPIQSALGFLRCTMRKICLTVDLIGDLYAFIHIVSSVQEALWKVHNITFTPYPGIVPRFEWNIRIELNPFTAAACKKNSGWNIHGRACKQYIFRSYNICFQCFAFSWLSFHMPVQKRKRKKKRRRKRKEKEASGFEISHYCLYRFQVTSWASNSVYCPGFSEGMPRDRNWTSGLAVPPAGPGTVDNFKLHWPARPRPHGAAHVLLGRIYLVLVRDLYSKNFYSNKLR